MLTNNTTVDPIVASTKEIAQDVDRARFEQVEHNRYKSGEIFTVGAFGDLDFGPAPGELVQKVADVPSVLTAEDMKSYTPPIVTNVAVQVKIEAQEQDIIFPDDIDADSPQIESSEDAWDRPYSRDKLDRMTSRSMKFDPEDTGNAQRFEILFGPVFVYNTARKSWFFFNGRHWDQCKNGEAETAMHQTLMAIKDELAVVKAAADWTNEKSPSYLHMKKIQSHFKDACKAGAIGAALKIAQLMPSLKIEHEKLGGKESDHLYTVGNGTYNLKTNVLQPFNSKDYIYQHSDVPVADTSDCPRFKKFLSEIFMGDMELVAYYLRIEGASMLGGRKKHQEFYMFQGLAGSNGKTTLADVIKEAMGTYSVTSKYETWTDGNGSAGQKDGSAHSTDLAELDNARRILVAEVPANVRFKESRIKSWTGGEEILARHLNERQIKVRSNGTLILSSNFRQKIDAGDSSMWRRNKALPFNAHFSNDSLTAENVNVTGVGNNNLLEELREELPQILRLLIDSCMEYQSVGLHEVPQAVKDAQALHKKSVDTVAQFIEECCTSEDGDKTFTKTGDLYKAYAKWVEQEQGQQTAMQRKSFVEAMARLGHKEGDQKKYSNARVIPRVVMHHNLDF